MKRYEIHEMYDTYCWRTEASGKTPKECLKEFAKVEKHRYECGYRFFPLRYVIVDAHGDIIGKWTVEEGCAW